MKRILYISFFLLVSQISFGQDPQFSNPGQVETYLNPGLTGLFNGCYRISTNLRNQWLSTGAPIGTYLVAMDEPIKLSKFPDQNFGIGFHILRESAAKNAFSFHDLKLNLAYHKYIDYDKKHKLSFGVHAGIVQASINLNQLGFENQFNSVSDIDITRNNGENFQVANMFDFDVNTGVNYRYTMKTARFNSGLVITHLRQPSFSIMGDQNDSTQLNRKITFHGTFTKDLSKKNKINLASYNYFQGGNHMLIFGGSMMYKDLILSGENNSVELGFYHRLLDAFILNFKAKYNNHIINFTYDVNVSGYVRATQSFGGFEIGYTRNIQCKPQLPTKFSVPCLRL